MRDTLLFLDTGIQPEPELSRKAVALLESFSGSNMSVGEIDFLLSKARSLLAFSTFQGISVPKDLQTQQKSA